MKPLSHGMGGWAEEEVSYRSEINKSGTDLLCRGFGNNAVASVLSASYDFAFREA